MATATLLGKASGTFTGDAKHYRLDPPIQEESWDGEGGKPQSYEYVVISAVFAMFSGPETYIFPANAEGEVIDWGELPGSFQGGWSHKSALQNAGYDLIIGDVE